MALAHRLLAVQKLREAKKVNGIVEADETYFRTSYRGSRGWKRGNPPENRPPRYRGGPALKRGLSGEQVPVVTALDRAGGVIERVLPNRKAIERPLAGCIEEGSILCTDRHPAYVQMAKAAKCEHRRFKMRKADQAAKMAGSKPRQESALSLGRVNEHHLRLKTILNRQANGVSTRYLPAYLGWLRSMRRAGFTTADLLLEPFVYRLR